MTKTNIICKACNQKFCTLLAMAHHICPNQYKKPKWDGHVGRNCKESEAKQKYPNWLSEEFKKHLEVIRNTHLKQNKTPRTKEN